MDITIERADAGHAAAVIELIEKSGLPLDGLREHLDSAVVAIRVGINGFGRIGRLALRAGWGRRDLQLVHVNEIAAAAGVLNGILGDEERPLVSVDYEDDPRSAIIDALSTMVVDATCVKVVAWYDNEIGYVHRMIELAPKVAAAVGVR